MPIKSKFKGFDLVMDNEGFKVGDYYYCSTYENLIKRDFNIREWAEVVDNTGPKYPGQTFKQRHKLSVVTVIRKSSESSGLPRRLVMSKVFSSPLPLP